MFDLRPLRQHNVFGISVSEFDHGRRSREQDGNATTSATSDKTEEQQQQQDFSKLIPELLEKSIKESGGAAAAPENLVLRFRFENVANNGIMNKIFLVLRSTFAPSSAATTIFNKDKLKTFTLDLERCGITDDILAQLLNYFEHELGGPKPVLTHLFLAGNVITAKGLQILLHQKDKTPPLTTETGKNLHHLGVTANPLGGRGLDVLSEFLEINPMTNKIKILHATRIAWTSQSAISALKAKIAAPASANSTAAAAAATTNETTVLPAPVALPPGGISVYEAERFANATRNSRELTTVYFKQNTIQSAVDEEIEWPKKVILEDSS